MDLIETFTEFSELNDIPKANKGVFVPKNLDEKETANYKRILAKFNLIMPAKENATITTLCEKGWQIGAFLLVPILEKDNKNNMVCCGVIRVGEAQKLQGKGKKATYTAVKLKHYLISTKKIDPKKLESLGDDVLAWV